MEAEEKDEPKRGENYNRAAGAALVKSGAKTKRSTSKIAGSSTSSGSEKKTENLTPCICVVTGRCKLPARLHGGKSQL